MVSRVYRWLWSQAWLVLGFMAFVSGANGVAARIATNQMPPLVLVFLRWFIVCISLAFILSRAERTELRELALTEWRRIAWMGLVGYTGFSSLFYTAAYHTSAINLTLLQSAIPAMVMLGAVVVYRIRIRALQILGMGLTFFGVLIVSAKGDLMRLSGLTLNSGDGFVLLASLCYAIYTLGLRARPAGSALVFFAGMSMAALIWSIPIAAAEIIAGAAYWPSKTGWLMTLLIAFGPSFSGQICYMRGVDLIGPARAGLFANLIPIFGAFMAVVILRETFTAAHAIALVLGFSGVALAEWSSPPGVPPSRRHAEATGDTRLP